MGIKTPLGAVVTNFQPGPGFEKAGVGLDLGEKVIRVDSIFSLFKVIIFMLIRIQMFYRVLVKKYVA